MGDRKTITAKTIGNPGGGELDDPWPSGHPVEGERVAIFAFEVTNVDGQAEAMRSYHVAPVGQAAEGPIGPRYGAAQGISSQWTGTGTGTVVRPADRQRGDDRCEVAPDDPGLLTITESGT
jgi:hypothetical protein